MPIDATARLIAIDWGTSALRGWLLGDGGAMLDMRRAPLGIMAVADGDFEAAYRDFTADWRRARPGPPALAAGMIGSRQGWREAPYVSCPAGLADLATHGVAVGGGDARLRIVPGLSWRAPDGLIDVMRGEETQVFGALQAAAGDAPAIGDGLFILPGTHSKWVQAVAGRIAGFATYMTGELFAVLRGHSILGRMMPADGSMPHDAAAFAAGVRDGLTYGAELPRRLFGVRTG
ncbi:MAG TPA: 2-dehydro-3-deoxygalactonokinase, partial [Vineibacter sp.]|nr:2-dehydro-3-deoxygalactonokinase [Vineibacter sp.]